MSQKTKEGKEGKGREGKGRGEKEKGREGKGRERRPLRTLVWDVSVGDVYNQGHGISTGYHIPSHLTNSLSL